MATGLQRFVFTFLLPFFLFSQSDKISFEHITVEDGLSTGFIKYIFQDSRGYIWIGTRNGLNKYDGYRFTVYKKNINNPYSLSGNEISKIYEDNHGNLWVGTHNGLNRYDRNLDQFVNYKNNLDVPSSISNNHIQCIYEDRSGQLWIGTAQGLNTYNQDQDNFSQTTIKQLVNKHILDLKEDKNNNLWIGTNGTGLFKLDHNRENLKHYPGKRSWQPDKHEECGSLSNPLIRTIYETRSGDLWFGTHLGLNKYIPQNDCFENHYFSKSEWVKNLIVQVTEDSSANLWIGAWNGLYKIPPESQVQAPFLFQEMKTSGSNSSNLSSNTIYSLFVDRTGILWVATHGSGVNKLSFEKSKFMTYREITGSEGLKKSKINYINAFGAEANKTIWLGTNDGLVKFNRKTSAFKIYKHNRDNRFSISNNHVNVICPDTVAGRQILWIGTDSGVNRFDVAAEKFYSKEDLGFPYVLRNNGIWEINKDQSGIIWFGTVEGFFKYDSKDKQSKIKHYSVADTVSGGYFTDNIETLFKDGQGLLWVGTSEDLIRFDQTTGAMKHMSADSSLNFGSDKKLVGAISKDDKNRIWFGTNNGLYVLNKSGNKFTRYSEQDGLPSNVINRILNDDYGRLWLSTPNGIALFDPETITSKNYDLNDGLQGKEFLSSYKCPITGYMFHGGFNAFNLFHPDSLTDNNYIPPVVITDIRIHNQPVPIMGKSVTADSIINNSALKAQIAETDTVSLPYTQNYISFEFAALDYNAPQKNNYAYKMDGVDRDWVYTDASRRFATYTQLDPGEYTFRVKGSNNDGLWNEQGNSLRIIITPPWWRTNLAYGLYIIFVLLIIFAAWRLQVNRLNVIHEMEMEHLHTEKLQEIDQMKSRFFANISHEFRTPLTLIQGPVKQMLNGDFIGNIKQQYKMILRNTNRLLALVNQLLDLSKLDGGKMKLKAEALDVIFLLRGLVQSFESLAKQKQIELLFETTTKYLTAFIDRDKFEKIINNLLSNAFKFTAQWGKITVAVCTDNKATSADFSVDEDGKLISSFAKNRENKLFRIVITDSGRGIAHNQIDNIFDRFQQADNAYNNDSKGTGIGLALTKELVELHQGKIDVESKIGAGTSFTVCLPLGRDHLSNDQIIDTITATHKPEIIIPEESLKVVEEGLSGLSTMAGRERPLVLIVEDNADVRSYLHSNLYAAYRIIEAANGANGFERAVHNSPDLLISDVMMPKMDGFELCRKIKSDERTSHIPLILLTARAAHEDKIAGLQTGADDYIAKPFDVQELLIRSKNLIEQRRLLRQKFAGQNIFNAQEIATTPTDLSFLERAKEIIENNIANAAYNVEHFAQDICLSRSQLHRKIKALTNYPASRFIRILRLQHAYNLLSKDKTIAEVAYEVGFNNPAYFSDCFRQQFGKLPSEHLNSV